MTREIAAAILEHHMPKKNIHNKNKVDYLAYATAINALRNEDAVIDRVLEIIDDGLELENKAIKATANQIQIVKQIKDRVLALKGGGE